METIQKIRPLNDWVLIAISKKDKTTKSGLFIPQTAREQNLIEAKVVAVGPGRWVRSLRSGASRDEAQDWTWAREPLGLEPGETVFVDDAIRTVENFPAFRLAGFEDLGDDTLHLVKVDALRCKVVRD